MGGELTILRPADEYDFLDYLTVSTINSKSVEMLFFFSRLSC